MPQYLSFERETINPGALEIYKQRIGEILAGRDPMETGDRKVRLAVQDAVPFVGPRGGVRPPIFTSHRDDVCEDGDAEDAFVSALDQRHAKDNLPEPDDQDDEDWPMFVGGAPLDTYLALHALDQVTVNGKSLTEWRDDAAHEDDVDDESYSRIEALGWRGGDRNIYRNKKMLRRRERCGKSQRSEMLTSRFGGASIRTEAIDRVTDVDPWTTYMLLSTCEECDDDQECDEMEDVYMDHLWDDDLCTEAGGEVSYALLDLDVDVETVRALYVDGRLREAIGLLIDARAA